MGNVGVNGAENGVASKTSSGWAAGGLPDLSVAGAARLVGVGMLVMFVLGILVEGVVFSAIVVPANVAATVANIESDWGLLGSGLALYAVILSMDFLVAWGLFVVLRPVNREHALLMSGLRLVYASVMAASLVALPLLRPEAYEVGQMVAYVFFIAHLLVLGYLTYISGYVPRALGALVIVASLCYVFLTYGEHVLPQALYSAILPVATVPAVLGEVGLGVWLLWRARGLPGRMAKGRASGEKAPGQRARLPGPVPGHQHIPKWRDEPAVRNESGR